MIDIANVPSAVDSRIEFLSNTSMEAVPFADASFSAADVSSDTSMVGSTTLQRSWPVCHSTGTFFVLRPPCRKLPPFR